MEAKQKELDDLKAETILVIRGVSALDKELLGTLVAEAKDALETLEKQLVQAQEEYEEATKTAKRSNYICNEDVYKRQPFPVPSVRQKPVRQAKASLPMTPRARWQKPINPVSYTHLDVYKRQVSDRGLRAKWLGRALAPSAA